MQMGGGGGGGSGGGGGGMDIFGVGSAMASKKASEELKKYTRYAMIIQKNREKKAMALIQPWYDAGKLGLETFQKQVQAGPGEYKESPYYNFLVGEGVKAREMGAAARGKLFSGQQAKELTAYGENVASMDYQNWLNNWYKSLTPNFNLATMGQAAGAQQVGTMQQGTQNTLGLTLQMGGIEANQWLALNNAMNKFQATQPYGGLLSGGGGGGNALTSMYGGGTTQQTIPSTYGGYWPSEMNMMSTMMGGWL
jgi:hypothetical protein